MKHLKSLLNSGVAAFQQFGQLGMAEEALKFVPVLVGINVRVDLVQCSISFL
jgi:hypothetical protein